MTSLFFTSVRFFLIISANLLMSLAAMAEVLFETDFESEEIAPLYERFPKMVVRKGELVVTQGTKHAASPTLPLPFTDGVFTFRFRLDDKVDHLFCRFEDSPRIANTHSHLCRLKIHPDRMTLELDQPPKDRSLREAAVFATHDHHFADGEWHSVKIEFKGSTLTATINDEITLSGNHDHLAAEKTGVFFVLKSGEARLDDLRLESAAAAAAEPTTPPVSEDLEQSLTIFRDYVEQTLARNCYECHSHEAKKAKGGLIVDSLNPMLKGGDLGPALIPGDAEASLLYEAITYHDDDMQMPPDGKIGDLEIEKIRQWIELGAAHPRAGPELEEEKYNGPKPEELWSVQPYHLDEPKEVGNEDWSSGEIDRFLLSRIDEAGLTPSAPAEPSAILRRLHYVLTGLPPRPEEVQPFLKASQENSAAAITEKVDELLASPHFGERWGRHWLDIARYADVSGATNPKPFDQAWRYRQWAIHSFNTDKPWPQFVKEQLAGDLIEAEAPKHKTEQLIATGYLSLPHVLAADRDKERLKLDTIDEQLDVLGRTFLGIQIGCARCHDHKIDPFPTADYYAMAGLFRSTQTIKASTSQETVEPGGAELKSSDEKLPLWMQGGKGVRIHSVTDNASARDEPIHLRGEPYMLGEVVPRGFPTLVAMQSTPAIKKGESGREQLAEWILSPENTLAARVIVNRVWHHVFGQGLVRTTDNFGLTGDLPSHPELLDYLAVRFRDHHEHSFKSFIRELVLTSAFRQASHANKEGLSIDPENRLLWRANLRRSDAEALVDSIQFASGTLDLTPASGTAPEFKQGNQASTFDLKIPPATLRKRAIYWPVFRKDVPVDMDILGIFDFPPATSPRGTRAATRVPSQSLALLNSTLVLDAARKLSQTLPTGDEETRVRALYERTLSRLPTPTEEQAAIHFLQSFASGLASAKAAKSENIENVAWNRLCHTLLASNEFITIP